MNAYQNDLTCSRNGHGSLHHFEQRASLSSSTALVPAVVDDHLLHILGGQDPYLPVTLSAPQAKTEGLLKILEAAMLIIGSDLDEQ